MKMSGSSDEKRGPPPLKENGGRSQEATSILGIRRSRAPQNFYFILKEIIEKNGEII
jgi:hypothetical protein